MLCLLLGGQPNSCGGDTDTAALHVFCLLQELCCMHDPASLLCTPCCCGTQQLLFCTGCLWRCWFVLQMRVDDIVTASSFLVSIGVESSCMLLRQHWRGAERDSRHAVHSTAGLPWNSFQLRCTVLSWLYGDCCNLFSTSKRVFLCEEVDAAWNKPDSLDPGIPAEWISGNDACSALLIFYNSSSNCLLLSFREQQKPLVSLGP